MKFTVFGVVVVTSKVPAVSASVPAIPKTELEPSCRLVPFSVTLNRFAVPERVEVPVKVTVPAVAESEPPTERFEAREKPVDAVTLPLTLSALNVIAPEPLLLIVFEVPLSVIVPALAENVPVPLAETLPVTVSDVIVLVDPENARLSNEIPVPEIVFATPLIVKIPPEECVNVPDPLVAKFPAMVRFEVAAAVMPEPVSVRLLRLYVPAPLMLAFVPLIVTVLVPPVNVPVFVNEEEMLYVPLS